MILPIGLTGSGRTSSWPTCTASSTTSASCGAAASALVVLAREGNFFVLSDFFPVFSWHDADIKPNNMSLIFDLDAVLFPGFRVMGQFGFDDISQGLRSQAPATRKYRPFSPESSESKSRPLSFAGLDLYARGRVHPLPLGHLQREVVPGDGDLPAWNWTRTPTPCP